MINKGFKYVVNNNCLHRLEADSFNPFVEKNLSRPSEKINSTNLYYVIDIPSGGWDVDFLSATDNSTNKSNLFIQYCAQNIADNDRWFKVERNHPSTEYFSASNFRNNVHEALGQAYAKSSVGSDAEALQILYTVIETALRLGKTDFVDELLNEFRPELVKRMVSVGLVRGTYRIRKELKSWQGCLARVAYNLTEDKQPASHLLRGLYKADGQPLLARKQPV